MSANATGFVRATFAGHNGAGAISVPGLKVGDAVIWCARSDVSPVEWVSFENVFEIVVTVDDELQQGLASDYSSRTFDMILVRGV